jgi:hypothetical protein
MEWQSIDTAPKDGTEIILYQPDGGLFRIAGWVDTSEEVQELVSTKGKRETYEWVKRESGYWDAEGLWNPSHWMPLPPAPAHHL